MSSVFDHEKLKVYQRSLDFVVFVEGILSKLSGGVSAKDQLDRASTSISLNIAEVNGKFTSKDRCRFFDIARGSALESAAVLDVLVRRKKVDPDLAREGKAMLLEIVSMLVGLIKSQRTDRLYEEQGGYNLKEAGEA